MRALPVLCVLANLAFLPAVSTLALAFPSHGGSDEQKAVAKAQTALAAMGLYHGTTNGTLGPQTREALAGYQRKVGLPVTERVDGRTALALANPELVAVCEARHVAIAECLDAIAEFQAYMVKTGPKDRSSVIEETCRGAKARSECAEAVAAMDKWLSAQNMPLQ
jgi:peptidoglycan hydrolase-like protein with peptidoglycan-binding domain